MSLADAGGRLMYTYKDVLEHAVTPHAFTRFSQPYIRSYIPSAPPSDTVAMKHFELKGGAGEHLSITSTNSVGKTAVTCIVAGLWAGSVNPSAIERMLVRSPLGVLEDFVVPQRAYMTAGTLFD